MHPDYALVYALVKTSILTIVAGRWRDALKIEVHGTYTLLR